MNLNVNNPRKMLIIRMQAWTYENINQGDMDKAQRHAETALRGFDDMIDNNPTDEAGYWSGFYFTRFKGAMGFLG